MNIDILSENHDISNLSNFKTKAYAKFYYEINSLEDIKNISLLYKKSIEENIGFLIIWGWTNMLFAFDIFDWIIINNKLSWWTYNKESKILESYSNEKIWDISKSLEDNYWQNIWHRFIGLPGSIWWALFWNAWCFWLEIENNFLKAELLDIKNWQIIELWQEEMDFSYRSSKIKKEKKYFIIKSSFDLSKKVEKYHSDVDNIYFRENKQPKWNTCWSFFKNPSREQSAWLLIELVWLKWFLLWTAFFSDLHSNFLISKDNWTYKDLLSLISLAKEKVLNQFWIKLEEEVRIIYNKK